MDKDSLIHFDKQKSYLNTCAKRSSEPIRDKTVQGMFTRFMSRPYSFGNSLRIITEASVWSPTGGHPCSIPLHSRSRLHHATFLEGDINQSTGIVIERRRVDVTPKCAFTIWTSLMISHCYLHPLSQLKFCYSILKKPPTVLACTLIMWEKPKPCYSTSHLPQRSNL